jgi:hypothetical protein
MSIITAKRTKKYDLIDFVFVFIALLVAFLVLVPSNIHLSKPVDRAPVSLSASDRSSFTSDLQYWNADCSHGWKADSTCEAITRRTQACSISNDSAYCAAYHDYLHQHADK